MQPEDLNFESILAKSYFVPMSTMRKVTEFMESHEENDGIESLCQRNIVKLQRTRTSSSKTNTYYYKSFRSAFQGACYRAIYSQNWNKLLYLLKKSPPWDHILYKLNEGVPYFRALLILLMYHPTSQAQGLLNDYLHLVWSCRTDNDKKAMLKILLTLPEKLHGVTYGKYVTKDK